MSWVEELTPDDEVEVEIIFPKFYVDYCMRTIKKFSSAAACYCKGAAILGEDETEFYIKGITVLQSRLLKEAMAQFGVELEYEVWEQENLVLFYADVQGLKRRMEDGEFDIV